jgi:hypothetical protein
MKTSLKTLWNRVPEERRGLAIALLCAVPVAAVIVSLAPTPEEVAAENAAVEQQATQVASQQAASDALQREVDLTNSVRSECWQFARRSVKDPSSLQMVQEGWINGDVTSDFVVIQPISAENSFGARTTATAVCSGNNGVVTSYQMDN